jgi:UDP-N-acetylglucosamine transferase subunit ALG13
MARVVTGSASGRILARFGAKVLVQWPDLLRVYPRATVCRPTLLEGLQPGTTAVGSGTFVTVGSHDAPFDRLLQAVDEAADEGLLPRPILVQQGVSERRQRNGDSQDFMTPENFRTAVQEAAVVVTHGGAGAIATALRFGKVPLVMARRAGLGEHVDDHQQQLVSRLDELGVVVQLDDRVTGEAVKRARLPLAVNRDAMSDYPGVGPTLAELI